MKTRLIKILVLALAMVMMLTSCDAILGIFGGTPAHECENACETCGKCTDESCTEDACADKCEGHKPAHTCESVCPDCGKCTDANCTEDACATKCEGHVTTTLVLDPTADDVTVQQGPQNIRIGSFDIILSSEKSRIESKNVDFNVDGDYITHDARINFNGSPTMTPETSDKNEWENAVRFVASGKGKVTIFWQHAGKPHSDKESDLEKARRNVALWDENGNIIQQSDEQYDYEEAVVTTLEFDKAGTYYVGNLVHANYFFYIEVVHEGEAVELPAIPTYTVTFNSNEGSAVDPITVAAGTFFKRPNDPTKDGHMFGGWYKDEALTEEFNFASDKVTANTTLYAKWIVIESGTEVTYVLDASTLDTVASETKADGDTLVVNNFFTIHFSTKTKIDNNNKTFADEYKGTRRINFNSKATVGETTKDCIEITTKGAATVKIWWVSADNGREMTILDAEGNEVVTTNEGSTKDALYISELSLSEAGTYFIGGNVKKNYIFKIEVVVTE